jgi:hypothetical protein
MNRIYHKANYFEELEAVRQAYISLADSTTPPSVQQSSDSGLQESGNGFSSSGQEIGGGGISGGTTVTPASLTPTQEQSLTPSSTGSSSDSGSKSKSNSGGGGFNLPGLLEGVGETALGLGGDALAIGTDALSGGTLTPIDIAAGAASTGVATQGISNITKNI